MNLPIRPAVTGFALLIGIAGIATELAAQPASTSALNARHFGFSTSAFGDRRPRVASISIDPMMTPRQEAEIIKILQSPCPFDWNGETSIWQLADDLGRLTPTQIRRIALEDYGFPSEPPSKARGSGNQLSSDPFGGPLTTSDQPPKSKPSGREFANRQAKAEKQSEWWKLVANTTRSSSPRPSIAASLRLHLQRYDFPFHILGGIVLFSNDDDHETGRVRLYDISMLVPARLLALESNHRSSNQNQTLQRLVIAITSAIEPDTWEHLGGPSTISAVNVDERVWLVVRTTTEVHWQVEAMLESLASDTRASPLRAEWSRSTTGYGSLR
ncbi:MAG: hypothetical protein AAGA03_12895 [Planctomycetota bacterium]